jgi:hypothetical protein
MSELLRARKKGVIKVIQELDVLVVEVSTFVPFFLAISPLLSCHDSFPH